MKKGSGTLGNPGAQAKLRGRDKDVQRLAKEDLGAVLATQAGRRFIWRLLEERCRGLSSSYSANALEMAFLEGVRSVGCHLVEEIQREYTSHYVLMLEEQMRERQLESAIRDEAERTPDEG